MVVRHIWIVIAVRTCMYAEMLLLTTVSIHPALDLKSHPSGYELPNKGKSQLSISHDGFVVGVHNRKMRLNAWWVPRFTHVRS